MVRIVGIVLIIALIVVGGLTAYDTYTAATHSPQYLTAQEQLELQQQEDNAQFWLRVRYVILVLLVVAVAAWRLEKWADKGLDALQILAGLRRSQDGTHALIHRTETGIDPWTGEKIKVPVVIDPDRTIGLGVKWDRYRNEYVPMTGQLPIPLYYQLAEVRSRTVHTASAMFPGDRAYIDGEVKPGAAPRLLGGAARAFMNSGSSEPPTIDQPLLPPPPAQQLTPLEAFTRSKMREWIIGQNPTTGQLATWDPVRDINMGVVGTPGQGKSSCVLAEAAALAIRDKHHLILLDGKGGSDFGGLKTHCEYYPTDGGVVFDQMKALHAEYERRQAVLNQHQATNLAELAKKTGIDLPYIFVLFDEFGPTLGNFLRRQTGQGSGQIVKDFYTALGNTMRLGRAAGIRWIVGDQNISRWPDDVLTALNLFMIVFRLDSRQAGAVGEARAPRLNRNQFLLNGEQYQAFHFAPELPNVLAQLPAQTYPRLLEAKPAPTPAPPKPQPVTITVRPTQPAAVAYAQDAAAAPAPEPETPADAVLVDEETVELDPEERKRMEDAEWRDLIIKWICEDIATRLFAQYSAVTKTASGNGAAEVGRLMARQRLGEEGWAKLSEAEQQKAGDDLKSQASKMLRMTRPWMYENTSLNGYTLNKDLPKGK